MEREDHYCTYTLVIVERKVAFLINSYLGIFVLEEQCAPLSFTTDTANNPRLVSVLEVPVKS